jgi:hypothetical protein
LVGMRASQFFRLAALERKPHSTRIAGTSRASSDR